MGATIEIFRPKTAEQALKDCPFCGGSEVVYEKYQHTAGERWKVWCTQCMASIDSGYAQELGTVQRMWNRRV